MLHLQEPPHRCERRAVQGAGVGVGVAGRGVGLREAGAGAGGWKGGRGRGEGRGGLDLSSGCTTTPELHSCVLRLPCLHLLS